MGEQSRSFDDLWGSADGAATPVADVAVAEAGLLNAEQGSAASLFWQSLQGLSAIERAQKLVEVVRREVNTALKLPAGTVIPADQTLKELGLSSLMASELPIRLGALVGRSLPASLLFDHPTVRAVAEYLASDPPPHSASRESVPAPAAAGRTTGGGEPIAIVGMACRTPGGVADPEALWNLIHAERNAITSFPADRGWDLDKLYDPDPEAPGKSYVRHGGFLHELDQFDATLFGISPREAVRLDPQQRLLLEVAWEALESAGIAPLSLGGSRTGVYIGGYGSGYDAGLLTQWEQLDGYVGTGNALSTASGRISYTLGLQGPALTVDTACSSSLVSLHLACQSLRSGECDLALAGGVTLMITPGTFIEYSRLRALAVDGMCKPFSARADGTGWSEGCGLLVLERLSDAEKQGHRALAVIRGSAVNQDGRSQGLTAPSGPAQVRVIEDALRAAGVEAREIDAVEAHGTGTQLGDPIEAHALLATYGQAHSAAKPLWLGSLKGNIGHAQAAAGVLGVMKMVLAMQRGEMPRTLHAEEPSHRIEWTEGHVKLLQQARSWERDGHPRRASVSSFGVSGTNAHMILEEAAGQSPATPATERVELCVLSAKSEEALNAAARRLAEHLAALPDVRLSEVAYSLATTRSPMEHRLSVAASSPAALRAALAAAARGETPAGVARGKAAVERANTAWLFPGQGAQRLGMGRELFAAWPAFREALEEAFRALDPHLVRPLREVMWASDGVGSAELLDQTAYTQPALFALEWALARLWLSWGVQPDLLAGHSIGEITSACVAGVFTLQEAARLVAARGLLMQGLPDGGAMVSITASEDEVAAAVAALRDSVSIAALNGPESVVISGDESAVLALAEQFAERGRRTKRLTVSHAFHSARMEPILDAFRAIAETIQYQTPRIPLVSNVSGKLAGAEVATPEYWVRHVRETVRFADGVRALEAAGARTYVEIGPKPTLLSLVSASIVASEPRLLASLHGERSETETVLAALGGWYVGGGGVDWRAVFPSGSRTVALPTYPFQRQRYWLGTTTRAGDAAESLGLERGEHPLLGAVTSLADGRYLFTGRLTLAEQPWLAGHVILGDVLLPGTAFVELALGAGERVGVSEIDSLTIERPLVLAAGGSVRLQIEIGAPADSGERTVQISGQAGGAGADAAWVCHASGVLRQTSPSGRGEATQTAWPPPLSEQLNVEAIYERLAQAGYQYGPSFRGLQAAYQQREELYAEVALAEAVDASAYHVHPALLDAALHAVASAVEQKDEVLLPFEWRGIKVHARGARAVRVRMRMARDASGGWDVALQLYGLGGEPVAEVRQLRLRAGTQAMLRSALAQREEHLYKLKWQECRPAETPPLVAGVCEVMGRPDGLAKRLQARPVAEWRELKARLQQPGQGPIQILWDATEAPCGGALESAHVQSHQALLLLQQWLHEPALAESELVVVTQGGVSTGSAEGLPELWPAALWGLCRSARSEHPERRIRLLDIERDSAVEQVRAALQVQHEPELAVRGSLLLTPRLVHAGSTPDVLSLPAETRAYQLDHSASGRLDTLHLRPAESALRPLAPHEVRLEVCATGINFRDVLGVLGMYPGDPGPLGFEAAGVVVETGSAVTGLRPGDRVLGLVPAAAASHAVADSHLLVAIPPELSFAQAATIPVAFTTAYHGLFELAQLRAGERVLIHAAAGGVGMAAVQLARHLGAEVFATASAAKWPALGRLGIDAVHLASSRSLDFESTIRATTQGQGVDVVLNSLAQQYVDASLRLLPRGGRFVELGKTDLRDRQQVQAQHVGVSYQAFDLLEVGRERLGAILREVVQLIGSGALHPLPHSAYDIRQAATAFRCMAQARHTGKLVLTLPRGPRFAGTVLITGGTGELGSLLARHLVRTYQVRHLLLTSRHGLDAPGALELQRELQSLGAQVLVGRLRCLRPAGPRRAAADHPAPDSARRGVPLRRSPG